MISNFNLNLNLTKKKKRSDGRFSILTDDLEHCYICKKQYKVVKSVNIHEVFCGSNRQKSIKYGCCIPVCAEHHTLGKENVQYAGKLQKELINEMKEKFAEVYPDIDFLSIFGKNYL